MCLNSIKSTDLELIDMIKKSTHPNYECWRGMKQRCLNPNAPSYKNYGARGISFDKKWNDFWKYVEDVGVRPSLKHTLDRIDVNKNYTKDNVRWVLWEYQTRNRRDTLHITYCDITMTGAEWSRLMECSAKAMVARWKKYGCISRREKIVKGMGSVKKSGKGYKVVTPYPEMKYIGNALTWEDAHSILLQWHINQID